MNVLYAVTVAASFRSSAGCTVATSVHPSVSVAPAWAAPISGMPNVKGTRTESPIPPSAPGAHAGRTTKVAGRGGAPGTRPFFSAKYVDPLEKNGIRVTLATPISTPPLSVGDATLSSIALYSALKVVVSVTFVVSPPPVAAVSTSLLPIQAVKNVGFTFFNICICVIPPRKNEVSAFGCDFDVSTLSRMLYAYAPGTATSLM